jgi:hypothetical protein
MIALLGLHLTARHWSIMRLRLAHSLLPVDELSAALESQPNSVRAELSELRKLS